MLKKLQSLYPSSIFYDTKPNEFVFDYHWFQESGSSGWLGIPKNDIHLNELEILKTLFSYEQLSAFQNQSKEIIQWQSFLYQEGALPEGYSNPVRIIQFECSDKKCDHNELQASLAGFFSENAVFLWLNNSKGIIIEEKSAVTFTEEDILSISNTFESDLFVKVYFYLGKFRNVTRDLQEMFHYEQSLFKLGLRLYLQERVFTFEKLFPLAVLNDLSPDMKAGLTKEVQNIFKEDQEMLITMKIFLENNLNVSLTAKKLYIHRNTLQYRIDKFIEKTGINLKSFSGAVTVYLACLNEEKSR